MFVGCTSDYESGGVEGSNPSERASKLGTSGIFPYFAADVNKEKSARIGGAVRPVGKLSPPDQKVIHANNAGGRDVSASPSIAAELVRWVIDAKGHERLFAHRRGTAAPGFLPRY
jgi:hypothetical protein